MAHHKLREDKKCQNCNSFVRRRFCPKCGQENVETRQSFHYLFTHFIEDLVHYDGSFWKTLKTLFFKPGVLTKEYLAGKRKKYVAPVKLYIFVSFFVFFVGGLISKITSTNDEILQSYKPIEYGNIKETPDSLKNENTKTFKYNLKEYDSIQSSLPEAERDSGIGRILNRKLAENEDKYTSKELLIKFFEVFNSNFQKFLFFYMPVFAFFLWLFSSKKKWYYFEHGIFTLHYFSFILLSVFITNSIISPISGLFNHWTIKVLAGLCSFGLYLWMFIYFFKTLRKVYDYSRIATFFRGIFLLFINTVFFIFGILFYIVIIFFLM